MRLSRQVVSVFGVAVLTAAACGGDSSSDADSDPVAVPPPTIVTTTGIWGDVVENVACGGLAEIETLIPTGGDPHVYEPSLRDRERMANATLVVANGLVLEERLVDTLEAVEAEGTPVFRIAEQMEALDYTFELGHDDHDDHGHDSHDDHDDHDDHDHDEEGHDDHEGHDHEGHGHDDHDHDEEGHDDHEGHDHDEDDHSDHDEEGHDDHDDHGHDDHAGHDHSAGDPHVWFDPHRVSEALPELVEALSTSAGLDRAALDECLSDYQSELAEVDSYIMTSVAEVPDANRKLVTNHEALGYFAARYGFEVIGSVIPSPSSLAQTTPAQLEELAEVIEHEQIPAVFSETQHSADDIEALAERIGNVNVVTLYTGSLGPSGSGADTYLGFLRTNTDLIVEALT